MAIFSSDEGRLVASLQRSSAYAEFALDGTVLAANPIFLTLLGWTREELLGQNHAVLVSDEQRQSDGFRVFWDQLCAGSPLVSEFPRRHKDGREVWLQGSHVPVMRGNRVAKIALIAADTTALHAARAHQSALLMAIDRSQAMIEFDLAGKVVDANANFLSVMGYTLAEVRGQHHRIFVDPAEVTTPEYAAFWERLRAGSFQVDQYRRMTKGGREVWLQASYNPLYNARGDVNGFVKLAIDITASKAAEREALNQVEKELSRQVESVAARISNTSEKAAHSAQAAAEASDNVQAMARGASELSSSVSEINTQVSRALSVSNHAVEQAERASATVVSLVTDADKISSVVDLISGIAAQTNLLALNATIEAARAGDAGKGFAVVAGEVKELAAQTGRATDEIKAHIAAVQSSSENAHLVIDSISSIISEMNSISVSISAAVEEQSAVAADMSANMRDASASVDRINTAMDEVSSLTQQARDAVFSIVENAVKVA